ncbi:MAG: hypothetical protein HZA07_02315 [Nitrospirae bacterium]|nr:hypothetical protein [Nitrospirota bacterium]
MIYILWTAIILLTFLIQGKVSLFDISPNFTSVLAYYAGIRKGEIKGMFFGSLIGILEDSLSGAFLGPNLLSKGLVGYLSSFMSGSFFRWTPLLGTIGISVLTLIDSTVVFLSRSIFDGMPVSIGAAAFIVAIQSLINAPLGIFIKPKDAK